MALLEAALAAHEQRVVFLPVAVAAGAADLLQGLLLVLAEPLEQLVLEGEEELRAADPIAAAAADPKTMLQEKLQANHQPTPQYTVVETLGPPHKRMFHVELKWNGGVTRGEGQTIKTAEAAAAQAALQQMQAEESAA